MDVDVVIFHWLNSWAGVRPLWDALIIFRATYLWYVVVAAAALFVIATFFPKFRKYRWRNTELLFFAFISAFVARFVVVGLIHLFYSRPRPFEVLTGVYQLVDHVRGGSFPSGHASLAFAVATAISFYYPKTSIIFFLAAISIGVGRVAAGVHWPSDILVGAAVGIATAWLVRFIWKRIENKTTA